MKRFLLCFIASSFICLQTWAAPEQILSAIAGLSPEVNQKEFAVGDVLPLQFLVSEKIGEENDVWELVSKEAEEKNTNWQQNGSFAIEKSSLKTHTVEHSLTKIYANALVTASGEAKIENLILSHIKTGKKIKVDGTILHNVSSVLTEQDKEKEEWLLGFLEVPTWDWKKITVFGILPLALLLAAVIFLLKKISSRSRLRKTLSPKDEFLQKIKSLEPLVRKGDVLALHIAKKFSYELSESMKKFLGKIYLREVHEFTDRELLQQFKDTMPQKEWATLQNILTATEKVRYAQSPLSASDGAKFLVEAKHWAIELHKPLEAEKKELK